jgi:HlyD family secretion protein
MGGRVAEILAKEGDQVKAGQALVKLRDADLKAALAQAQADLASLQASARPEELAQAQANVQVAIGQVAAATAELNRVQSGAPQMADLATAQAELAQAEARLKPAQDAYDNIRDGRELCKEFGVKCRALGLRLDQQAIQLEAARAAYTAAEKRVNLAQVGASADWRAAQARLGIATGQRDAAQAQLDLLRAGSTVEQIDAAKARVAQAQAALDEATLLAPFDGTIAELTINPGEMVAPDVRVASIADLANWQVDTDDLSEVDVVNVQPGAEVSITVDALPGVTLKGKVTSITPRSIVKRGDVTYTVKVAITDPDPRLKWGMTAFVDVRGK